MGGSEVAASPMSSHCCTPGRCTLPWALQWHLASSPHLALLRLAPRPSGADPGDRGRTAARTMRKQRTGGSWSTAASIRAGEAAPSRTRPVALPWARPAATIAGAPSAAPVAPPGAVRCAGRASPRRPRAAAAAPAPRAQRSCPASPTCGLLAASGGGHEIAGRRKKSACTI